MNIFFKSPLVLFFLLLLLPHGSPFAATSHMYPFCPTTVRAHNLNTKFQLMSLCAVSFHIYLSNKHTHTQCTSLFAFLFKQHRRESNDYCGRRGTTTRTIDPPGHGALNSCTFTWSRVEIHSPSTYNTLSM